jgi:tRNA threonylcarbamoyladenosine biosynthesis protein TsaB
MSNYLAIDCNEKLCSVAVEADGRLWQQISDDPRQQARALLPMLDEVLTEAGLSRGDIDAIVWTHGPGSFTASRISTAVAQGLGYALNHPIIPVSSLAVLAVAAWRTLETQERLTIGIAQDARMGEIFWARFALSSDGIERLEPDCLVAPEDLDDSAACDLLAGSGVAMLSAWDCRRLPELHSLAADAIKLAFGLNQSFPAEPPDRAEPLYLRTASAWKSLEAQQRPS